jgi:hypothetical protein
MRHVSRALAPVFCLGAVLFAQPAAEPPVKLAEVIVSPSRFGVAEIPLASAATLTAAELEVLPQVGDDLFRSIARLPGLAADDVSARFWVRGAPHSELLARLDGVDLIEPFHLKDVDGALSIIDPATIRLLDLSTGGFTAEYGGKLAGVLTMETKSAARPLTTLNLSLTGVGGIHQGVLPGNRGRWLVAGRRGYPDVALRISGRSDEISPRYYDLNAKVEYDLTPTQTLSLHALHAGDGLRYRRTNDPSLSSSYGSDYVWGRWQGAWGERVHGEGVLSWSRLTWDRTGTGRLDGFPFSLSDHRQLDVLAARQDWSVQPNDYLLLRAGLEGKAGDARYRYALQHQHNTVVNGVQVVATDAVNTALDPDGDSGAVYGAVRFQPLRAVVVEPGVRLEHHTATGDHEWSPRFNAAWSPGRLKVRVAWGEYTQAQGLQELSVADGERRFSRAERAEHRVVGVEYPLGRLVSLRVEAYERVTTHPRARWENLDNAYDLFPEAQSDRVLLRPERGRARGVEFLLGSRGQSTWQWHASYIAARAEERLAGRWVPRARDQRHAFYADTIYVLSPRWQFSAAWQFHTGWPTTDVVYSLSPLTNGRRLLVSANGPTYGLRLPDYHRLDLRVTRRFKLKRGELRTFLDVFNAYDRTNLLGYDHRVTVSGTQVTDVKKPREQLPLLPSVGVTWEF